MFVAGSRADLGPQPDDHLVAVNRDAVAGIDGTLPRIAEVPVTAAPRYIGALDGVPVWAAPTDATGQPWGTVVTGLAAPLDAIVARGVYDVRWCVTHRYCGECGGPLVDCPGYGNRRCPTCTTVAYVPQALTPAVLVAVTTADDGSRAGRERLLMVRHAAGLVRDRWSLIAGMVEAGETFEQTAAREVAEEVGVTVRDVAYVRSHPYARDNPATVMISMTATCDPDAVPVADGTELTAARFFDRDEIRAMSPDQLPMPGWMAYRLVQSFLDSGPTTL